MTTTTTTLAAENVLRLNLGWLDYVLVAIYFVFPLAAVSFALTIILNIVFH
jgi:SSS family solute:Na+ symporter